MHRKAKFIYPRLFRCDGLATYPTNLGLGRHSNSILKWAVAKRQGRRSAIPVNSSLHRLSASQNSSTFAPSFSTLASPFIIADDVFDANLVGGFAFAEGFRILLGKDVLRCARYRFRQRFPRRAVLPMKCRTPSATVQQAVTVDSHAPLTERNTGKPSCTQPSPAANNRNQRRLIFIFRGSGSKEVTSRRPSPWEHCKKVDLVWWSLPGWFRRGSVVSF